MPQSFFKKIEKQYPQEPLLAGNFASQKGYIAYREKIGKKLKDLCLNNLLKWIESEKIFTCDV
jgi:hypothetical protein